VSDFILHKKEYTTSFDLSEEELIDLLKYPTSLIESIDLKNSSYKTGYYVGIAWLANSNKALYVSPKFDNEFENVDYFLMLSKGLQNPEMLDFGENLFYIDLDAKPIEIQSNKDIITPLLIVYFLQILRQIVKKGLKKDYHKIENNIYTNIKGKVLVSATLRQNIFRNRQLYNTCSYEEFSVNTVENQILKKALLFSIRFLKITHNKNKKFFSLIDYILPAFARVSDEIQVNDIKSYRNNSFYTEYKKGLELARMILKRFGYNFNEIKNEEVTKIQPFWIDMPKLFEFYVLGILKENLGRNNIQFQASANYGAIDFLRITKDKEMVIDAKYKSIYQGNKYEIEDIRQLSAYARDKGALRATAIPPENWAKTNLDCVIIYPDQNAESLEKFDDIYKQKKISQFQNFYKAGIKIPMISNV